MTRAAAFGVLAAIFGFAAYVASAADTRDRLTVCLALVAFGFAAFAFRALREAKKGGS